MGQVKALLSSKNQKMQFFQSFTPFPNEIDIKEKIQIFYQLIINCFNLVGCWQQHQASQGAEPLPCTDVGRECKNRLCFEENRMKFLKMLVLTLILPQLLRCNRLNLHLLFLLNANFSKYFRAKWVKQKHCFVPKVKKASFQKVSPHFQMKLTKERKFKCFTGT